MTHIPRYLTRSPEPKPWRPLLEALEAYGVPTYYVPETTTLTYGRDGITLDVMIPDPEAEGLPMIHDDTFDPVTRRQFYPHPVRSRGQR